jgi:filamentous hemagglutinin
VAGVAGDAAAGGTSTVYRVQGGVMPNASKTLITLDANGSPIIQNGTLNISIGDASHAEYFQTLRPGSTVTSFDIPTWMDDFIQENAISQYRYNSSPLNQGGLAPKIVDPTTPGRSYELPSPWGTWLQENAVPGSGKVK